VAIMMLLYVCSYMDRSVLTMLAPHIQKDMRLTDFELGLLLGPAFGLLYVVMGLPAGWIADRYSRRWLVAIGATLWGLATAASGLASSYLQLAAARLSIGVGEASLTPAAHSMIVEQFPPQRLSVAMSVYMLGVTIGGGLALALSGVMIDAAGGIMKAIPLLAGFKPWQVVFLMVAAPTVVLAPLVFTVRDTRKGARPGAAVDPAAAKTFWRSHWRLLSAYFLGFGVTSIACNALLAWLPTYMGRRFGISSAEIGIGYGTMTFLATGAGQLLWSEIVDRLYSRGRRDIHALFHMGAWLISAPAVLIAFSAHTPIGFLIAIGVFFLFTFAFQGYANAGLQLVTPPQFRGRMSATFLANTILLGMLFGPTSVGFLTDFVFKDPQKLGLALTLVVTACAPLGMIALWIAARERRALETPSDNPATPPFATTPSSAEGTISRRKRYV
jgi:MFS family permease